MLFLPLAVIFSGAQTPNGIQITGPVPWIDVRAYGAKGDGSTDDRASIQLAITNGCPTSPSTPQGCTIFFPLTASGGFYKIGAPTSGTAELTIPPTQPGVTLKGQCAVMGVASSCSRLSSGQAGTTGLYILQVGDGTAEYEGLHVSDLAFSDGSVGGTLSGAINLVAAEHFTIDSVYCANFQVGTCIAPSGLANSATAVTQYGTISNLVTGNTKFPVQASYRTSSINLIGGDVECNLSAGANHGSIGMDIAFTNHNTAGSGVDDGGEWGIFGTHILNCDSAISLLSNAAFQDYGVLEQTGAWQTTGTGVFIDVISSAIGHSGGTVIAGSMSEFSKGVVLNSASVDPVTVSAAFNAVTTPFYGAGVQLAEQKANVLSSVRGTISVGAQIPSDLSFVGETAPSLSQTSTGKDYFDSTSLVFMESRNGGAFGFRGFVPSTGLTANHLAAGSNGTGDLADSGVSDNFSGAPQIPQVVGVVTSTGLTGNLGSTPIFTNAPAGQYQVSVYLNATTACTTMAGGQQFAAKIAYTDSNGAFTKTIVNLPFATSLPDNIPAVITFWQNSTQTLNVSGTYTACSTGTETVDAHFALVRLQ